MTLTSEQKEIINSTGDIKINAVAGSGKTTTLIEYARARPTARILYLAFNKAVKLEAEKKFAEKGISNVRIETTHSLAFGHVVRRSSYTIKQEGYKTSELVEILGLKNSTIQHAEYILATHILAFVSYFCNSDKARVQELNYEEVVADTAARQFAINFKEEISHQTRVFLGKMNNGEIPIIHDFYLKKFQLARPILSFDTILFDEGQDASGAMLDVFLSQPATKVIVGDTHQQIYGWRYAINSLEKVDYPGYQLSTSFRFDQEIAQLAAEVVSWKKHLHIPAAVTITGNGKPGKIKVRAVIARTNVGLLMKAIELLIEKKEIKSVYFEGRIESYTYANEGASIYDVLNLYQGETGRIRDTMIGSMKNMDELEEYIENTGDAPLRMLVELTKKYSTKIPGYIKKLKECHLDHNDKSKADMIFSTVHRCKGMEYDEVTLADDFINEAKILDQLEDKEMKNLAKLTEEVNLLYVAVTRVKSILHVPDNILPDRVEKNNPASKKGAPLKKDTLLKKTTSDKPASKSSPYEKTHPYTKERDKIKNANAPWTIAQDKKLKALFREGTSLQELARTFGRTPGAIAFRIKKFELE